MNLLDVAVQAAFKGCVVAFVAATLISAAPAFAQQAAPQAAPAPAVPAAAASAAQTHTPEEAQALVQKAAEALGQMGKEKAYAAFLDKTGPYWHGDLYVFVVNFDGVWESYPPKPDAVGTKLLDVTDVDGRHFVRDMITVARDQGEGWVHYMWKNPATKKIQPKSTYVKRVGDILVASGVYR